MKGNKNISVKQILHGRKYLRLRCSNLSADACSSRCAKCTGHREGGGEGGGGGDGGGGDPVEQESALPVQTPVPPGRLNILLQLRRLEL